MQQLARDFKHALRMFRNSPGFTATVIAVLSLGIGVNTAVFSVFNAVLLKRLPYTNANTLVSVEMTLHGAPFGPWTSPASFRYWRAQTGVFSDMTAISQLPRYLNYTGGDRPEQVEASQVSADYFRVLNVPLARGRPFTADEDRPGGPKAVVISYDFWQRRLGGADVLGKRLPLNGEPYTVVGITARSFRDLDPFFQTTSPAGNAQVLVPFQLDPNSTDVARHFNNLARLKPGVTLAQARARVAAATAAFRRQFPMALGKIEGFTVLKAQEAMTTMYGDPRPRLWVLLGAVGFVLLIACANAGNLLLMRGSGRAHEMAIRSSLGAGRGRIVRQLLTESLMLSLVGGVLGLFAGFLGMHALLAVNTAGLPRLGPGGSLVSIDWRVVSFTLALSIATGLVFGLAPALAGSRAHLSTGIKAAVSRSGGGLRRNKTRSVLVAVELGLSVVLLIGAALLIRTSLALGRVDPGFDPANVVMTRTPLGRARFPTARSVEPTLRAALERVRSIPGVEAAAATCCMPLEGNLSLPFQIIGRPSEQQPSTRGAGYVTSTEGYFATLGIPVLRGRAFVARDDETSASPVVLINRAMAKRFWSDGEDPLQESIRVGGAWMHGMGPPRRIIGIVGDVHYQGLDKNPQPTMYVPMAQVPPQTYTFLEKLNPPMGWIVRTRGDSRLPTAAVRKAIRQATGAPVPSVQSMQWVIDASVSQQRLNMLLMSVFGGAALLLAAIGTYGLLAYSVQQRTHEIGIRMALGADAERVKRTIVRQGMILAATGIAAGLVAAFYTAHVLASWLFEVKPRDPIVFVAVPVVLVLIALVSVWLPARRASRVNPLDALRYE